MIKNYKIFKESLLNKLEGPNEEEVLNNFLKQPPRLMLRNSAKHGFMLGVEKALEKDVNIENDYHIITNAIEGNNIDIVKLLVSKGAPIGNFSMCFINATKNGNLEMLKYIKSLGGNLNFRINVTDPFTFQNIDKDLMGYAAYYGHEDIIDYLVENGFDVNSPHIIDHQKKPLYIALENHHIGAVKTLLKHGAEVSAEVELLLHHYDYKKYQSIFNEYKKITESVQTIDEYDRLLFELDILKNKSKTFEEFETLVNYYGHRVIKDVDVSKLINTERVSGRPIKTTGPINVVEDIRNGNLYIIDGHNRTQEAKNNGQEKINAVVSRGVFTKKGNYFDPEIYILSDKYNINLKEFYNEKVTESVTDIFNNDDFDGYIIYTSGMEKDNILQIYKTLFSNGYKYGGVNDTDLLINSDFEKTFMLILKLRKVILVTSAYMSNDSMTIERFLSNNGLHEKYYLFKDLNDFKRIFNPLSLGNYFNNRKNIYESLLDKMEGPTKDEVWKNLGYEKSFESPEEFIYYIFDNLKRKMNKLEIRWVDKFDETVIKYSVLNKYKIELYVIEYLDLIYEIFNMRYDESKKIIVDILNKTFDIKEDINIFFIDNSDVY